MLVTLFILISPSYYKISGALQNGEIGKSSDKYWTEFEEIAYSEQGENNIRLATKMTALEYLSRAAALIQELETNMAELSAYREAAEMLRTRYQEEGSSGVKSYFEMLAAVAGERAQIRQSHRELQAMLDIMR